MSELLKCAVCNTEYSPDEERCKKCKFEFVIIPFYDKESMDEFQKSILEHKKKWYGGIEEIGVYWYDYSDIDAPKKISTPTLFPSKEIDEAIHWPDDERLKYGFARLDRDKLAINYYIKTLDGLKEGIVEIDTPSQAEPIFLGMRFLERDDSVEFILASRNAKENSRTDLYSIGAISPIL